MRVARGVRGVRTNPPTRLKRSAKFSATSPCTKGKKKAWLREVTCVGAVLNFGSNSAGTIQPRLILRPLTCRAHASVTKHVNGGPGQNNDIDYPQTRDCVNDNIIYNDYSYFVPSANSLHCLCRICIIIYIRRRAVTGFAEMTKLKL